MSQNTFLTENTQSIVSRNPLVFSENWETFTHNDGKCLHEGIDENRID